MNEFLENELFDSSVLLEVEGNPIFGEDNEIIGYEPVADYDLDDRYSDPAEVADEYFSDPDTMASELSALMDIIEAEDFQGSSDDGDPRMVRIMELANYLSWFYPEKLDKRFR